MTQSTRGVILVVFGLGYLRITLKEVTLSDINDTSFQRGLLRTIILKSSFLVLPHEDLHRHMQSDVISRLAVCRV